MFDGQKIEVFYTETRENLQDNILHLDFVFAIKSDQPFFGEEEDGVEKMSVTIPAQLVFTDE